MQPGTPAHNPSRRRTAALTALALALGTAGTVAFALPANAEGKLTPTFTSTSFDPGTDEGLQSVLADLDKDGDLDVVTSGASGFSIALNDGAGQFSAPVLTASPSAYTLDVADVNGDGNPDVVTAGNGTIYTNLGDGTGGFTAQVTSTVANPSDRDGVEVGDLNGDSFPDLAYVLRFGGTLDLYAGNGTGTFSYASTLSIGGNNNFDPILADLNDDGLDDVIVPITDNGLTSVALSTAVPFDYATPVGYPGGGLTAQTVDIDGDGDIDIATASGYNNSNGSGVLVNDGTGGFTHVLVDGPGAYGVAAADFNGDGTVDLAFQRGNEVLFFLNDGAETFTLSPQTYAVPDIGYSLSPGDLNADGKTDVVVTQYDTANHVLLNTTGSTAPVVTANPGRQVVESGQTATFTASATGNPTPTVQWQVSTDNGATYTNVSDGTDDTSYTTPALTTADQGNLYRAVFTNSQGSVTTGEGSVDVNGIAPVVTDQPEDEDVTSGEQASFTADASGDPAPSVQWQRSTDGGDTYSDVDNATDRTYSFTAAYADRGDVYRARFTNGYGVDYTRDALLTVAASTPAVTDEPEDQAVGSGGTAMFAADASGDPAPAAQWQVSRDAGATYTNIDGETGKTLEVTASYADTGTLYRAVFTSPGGEDITRGALLTVNPAAPVVTEGPVSQSAQPGTPVTFTADATGDPTPTVQWQVSTDEGATYTDIDGATEKSCTVTAAFALSGNVYRAVFSNAGGDTPTHGAYLTVNPDAPTVTDQPADQTVTAGENATFTADASGDPTPTVRWQLSTDGGDTYTDVDGATSKTLTVAATAGDNGSLYRAVFTSLGGEDITRSALLTVNTVPQVTGQPDSKTVTAGQEVTLTATAGGRPVPTVQWQVSADSGDTYTDIDGATAESYTFTARQADSGNAYRAVFRNTVGTATTNAAVVTVTPAPAAPSAPRNVAASQTGPGQVTITWDAPADQGSSPVTGYDVGYGNGGSGNGDSFSATARSAVFSGLPDGDYTATVYAVNAAGTSARASAPFAITTAPTPTQEPTATPTTPAPSVEPSVTPTTPAPVVTTAPPTSAPACPTSKPTVAVFPATITAGSSARVDVSALPANSTVELRAYTRPSTTYRVAREAEVAGTSTTFTVVPPRNTRLYAAVKGCETGSDSAVVNVRTSLTIAAVRDGVRTYTFSGDTRPARAGQLVSLYRVTASGRQVLTSQDRADSQGEWTVTRTFTGSGRFGFVARTGQDLNNAPGSSRVRSTLIY